MIKVLIINSTLERSGLSNVIFDLVNKIDKTEFDVQILTLSQEPNNSRINDFLKIPLKVYSLNISRYSSFIGIGKKLKKYVDEINPDIIHTNSFRATFLTNKFLTSYLRIVTVHGVIEENHSVVYGPLFGRLMAYIELRAFKRANLKTVVSDFLSNHYRKIGVVKSISNGIDGSKFNKISLHEKNLLRLKNNIPANSIVFVFSANLIIRKNPLLVIKAFLKANISNSYLVVLGDGPLMKQCKAISLPNILFFGQVNDVASYYQLGDVFISASSSEGLGLSVVEAAMCGMNCIVTDIPPHKEIFQKNPHCVRFYEIDNETQLIHLLRDSINLSFQFIDDNYLVSSMVQKYEKEYKLLYLSNRK